ncbi:MAG: hypothetical protein ACR2L1_07340 [Pyrinomonadaceae bacterium]
MEIKDQTVETATDSEGHEYISEMDATLTETSADGTESVAEMTVTADPDDPTDVEGQMTVTETAPDGTETITEYVANDEGVFKVEEESDLENAIEEIFGIEIGDDLTQVLDADGNPVGEASGDGDSNGDVFQAEPDFQTGDADFAAGDETYESDLVSDETTDASFSDADFEVSSEGESVAYLETEDASVMGTEDGAYPGAEESAYAETEETAVFEAEDPIGFETEDTSFSGTAVTDAGSEIAETTDTTDVSLSGTPESETLESDAASEAESAELADQAAHSQAATDAQASADEFIASGDYAAASEARETAENESWEAGDNSMLSNYDSADLSTAADNQENAEYYEAREAEHAQAGDYEAAKEDAGNAAYAVGNADYYAGGDDHTGQAKAEEYNMDNAVWQEGLADDAADNAVYHAEMGNFDAAETSANSAVEHQDSADHYGDLGEHGGDGAYYDPSSEVDSGGGYESTYDSHAADVDTSYDSGVDTNYDSGMDTGSDSGGDY